LDERSDGLLELLSEGSGNGVVDRPFERHGLIAAGELEEIWRAEVSIRIREIWTLETLTGWRSTTGFSTVMVSGSGTSRGWASALAAEKKPRARKQRCFMGMIGFIDGRRVN
jgi:hypothetical protein